MRRYNLSDIVGRSPAPEPWSEGDNIPWNELGFSQRMLKEHLSQEHDAASRRLTLIDQHVRWIHETVLQRRLPRVLDLGCGPGLYSSRLARLGYKCTGIDYSPASIQYARQTAAQEDLACEYIEQDLRTADFGGGFGLVMLIYGELNVFRRTDAALILQKAQQALLPSGLLLLEPHSLSIIRRTGEKSPTWFSEVSGLFLDRSHIGLVENFWNQKEGTATTRFYIIDPLSGEVSRYAQSFQAYTDEQYRELLTECGFTQIDFYSRLGGTLDGPQEDFFALLARKA